jgi:hypothetical protein
VFGAPDSGMPLAAPSFENLDAEVFTETGHFGGPPLSRRLSNHGRREKNVSRFTSSVVFGGRQLPWLRTDCVRRRVIASHAGLSGSGVPVRGSVRWRSGMSRRRTDERSAQRSSPRQLPRMSIRVRARLQHHPASRAA